MLIIYIIYLILFSIISFFLFIKDKNLAKNKKMRIKEKTLLLFCSLGGGIGGLLGRIVARHKTEKIYFSLIIYLSIITQLLILVISILCEVKIWQLQ